MSELMIAGQSTENSIKLSGEIEQEFKVEKGDTVIDVPPGTMVREL